MPRNGLFADDGRVTDFSLYARNRMAAIEGTATTLTGRVTTAESDINALESNLADGLNDQDVALASAVATEVAARNAAILVETNARVAALAALRKPPIGGLGSMTFSPTFGEQDTYVTFPVGYFAAAPFAVASVKAAASLYGVVVYVNNVTTSGMTVGMNIVDDLNLPVGRTVQFNWIAIPSL